jgi:DNA-binding transcriptional LysR family regulator
MDLPQLTSFLRVAEEGSVTRAAAALHLTQPAVTQHVRALERELGVSLFDRTERGMRLTQPGETLRDYARRSLGLLQEARDVLGDLERATQGRVVIGAGVTTSIFRLPEWLRHFQRTHPGVDVTVRTGRSREIATLALAREIDLGLVTSPIQEPALTIAPLFDEEIVLVAPPDHVLAQGLHTITELREQPLILFARGSGFREYLDRALAGAAVLPRVKMESDSVEAIKSFVEVGLGASFLPAGAVRTELETGTLVRARVQGLPPLYRTTSVLYRTDRYLNAGARAFLGVLQPGGPLGVAR